MYYDEYHNHKWAKNLGHARRLLSAGQLELFYRGEELPDGDIYAGMRVIAAYWVSVEQEMPLRLRSLLRGADHPEWEEDPALLAETQRYLDRYLADMRELVVREGIAPPERLDALVARGLATPAGWADAMRRWQEASEAALAAGAFPPDLVEAWFDSCLRSVANYNRYLIQAAVCAAALVKQGGGEALAAAVDATAEEFKWDVSRAFFADVLPAAGFEDIGDLMELGMRGMYADQYFKSGPEREVGEDTVRQSTLFNCELAGICWRVAEWSGLPRLALGYGICRYCEAHGEATMMITMPPMLAPGYRRVQSLGMDGVSCIFELTTTPADDMERILMVQERVFGAVE
jgi:hypothetical protein